MPRVLLPRVTVRAPQPAPVLVHREVIELEGLTESVRALCSEALRRVAEWLDGKAGRDPMAEYVQEDERGPSGEQEDAAVVEEALKAKAEVSGEGFSRRAMPIINGD